MNARLKHVDDISVITLQEEALEAANVKDFKHFINPIIEEHAKIVLDLSEVQFMDSSGLGSILHCLRKLNAAGGDMKLCKATKPVRALFELIRMHRIFEIYNTEEEAIEAFQLEESRIAPV